RLDSCHQPLGSPGDIFVAGTDPGRRQDRLVGMVEIRHILCPIDFSDASHQALEHAVAIAKWYGSRLAVLHVIRSPFTFEHPIRDSPRSKSGPREAAEPFLREQLNAWLAPAKAAGVTTDELFDDGNAARRILERATSVGADLMILGTHGRGGIERF